MRTREHIRQNMQAIKAKGSKIEEKLGKALWRANLIYRKHYKKLPGKPDFVLVRFKTAIFCDSHFWHGYKWEERKHEHKRNKKFWFKKIEHNIDRDRQVNEMLISMGWKVIRFWEHEIKEELEKCIRRVKKEIKQ